MEGQQGQRQGVREHHQVNTFYFGPIWLRPSCSEYSQKGERVQPHGQEEALTAFTDANACNSQQYAVKLQLARSCHENFTQMIHAVFLPWYNSELTIRFFLCRKQVAASHAEADRDQVVVPLTMEE